MSSPSASEQERARPLIILGMIGSLAAITSFFFLPGAWTGILGITPVHRSAWSVWQELAASNSSGATAILIAIMLVPACACIALLIGCVGLFRPLPQFLMRAFTLAMSTGLGLLCLCLAFFLVARVLAPDLGFLGMLAGYFCILIERIALSRARRGA